MVPRVSFRSFVVLPIACFFLLSFPGQSVAPQTPPEPSPPERERLAERRLNERLAVWQQRLQLQDWKVDLIMSHRSDLRPGTLGNIHWDIDSKSARIRVLNPNEYQAPFISTFQDMEFTVVHELIHLELASLPRNDASRTDEEYAVNHMADALLALDRQQRRPGALAR